MFPSNCTSTLTTDLLSDKKGISLLAHIITFADTTFSCSSSFMHKNINDVILGLPQVHSAQYPISHSGREDAKGKNTYSGPIQT